MLDTIQNFIYMQFISGVNRVSHNRRQGVSIKQIAEGVGASETTIRRWIEKEFDAHGWARVCPTTGYVDRCGSNYGEKIGVKEVTLYEPSEDYMADAIQRLTVQNEGYVTMIKGHIAA